MVEVVSRILPSSLKKLLMYEDTSSVIVFGDGKRQKATKRVLIPSRVGHVDCLLKCEIVDGTLPVLLSVKSLKNADVVLFLRDNCLSIGESGEKVHLTKCSTGHLAADLIPTGAENLSRVFLASALEKKDLLKLHKQFGHAQWRL